MSTGYYIKRVVICVSLLFLGFLLAIGLFFPKALEETNDYQIIYDNPPNEPVVVYARGEQTGLLGQHEAIVLSPENIASRNWSYNPARDLRYEGENYVLYKMENGVLHIYCNQVLPDIDCSLWGIRIKQETLATKRLNLIQKNSRENGYHIISVRGMTE